MTNNPIIAVSPSIQYIDMASSAIRAFVLVVGSITALAGFISQRDWHGVIVYIQSSPFTTVLATVMSVGAFAWSLWKSHKRGGQLLAAATDTRNSAIQLVTKGN